MTTPAQALTPWGLQDAQVQLIAARENAVFRVTHTRGTFALRLHRKGYRTDSQLAAELDWMAWLSQSGLSVPAPLPSLAGPALQHVAGTQVDVLTWLQGDTLEARMASADRATLCRLFRDLGDTMARLHLACDQWPAAPACDRPAWHAEGLLGEAPLWGRFWENPALSSQQAARMRQFRAAASEHLGRLAPTLDAGLIHADLVPANVLCTDTTLHLIDFDDGGFGYRLFELATALLKHHTHADLKALKDALIAGYSAQRALDTGALPLFMALRAATYVGWNILRLGEAGGQERNARFIAQAETMIEAYLAQ